MYSSLPPFAVHSSPALFPVGRSGKQTRSSCEVGHIDCGIFSLRGTQSPTVSGRSVLACVADLEGREELEGGKRGCWLTPIWKSHLSKCPWDSRTTDPSHAPVHPPPGLSKAKPVCLPDTLITNGLPCESQQPLMPHLHFRSSPSGGSGEDRWEVLLCGPHRHPPFRVSGQLLLTTWFVSVVGSPPQFWAGVEFFALFRRLVRGGYTCGAESSGAPQDVFAHKGVLVL